jgi:hypothetical protein
MIVIYNIQGNFNRIKKNKCRINLFKNSNLFFGINIIWTILTFIKALCG